MATATRPVDAKALRLGRHPDAEPARRAASPRSGPAIDRDRQRRAADAEDLATILRRSTTETPPIPRFILEDRYDGLLSAHDDRLTKIGAKLFGVAFDIVDAVARNGHDDGPDGHAGAADEALAAFREALIAGVDSRGIAR